MEVAGSTGSTTQCDRHRTHPKTKRTPGKRSLALAFHQLKNKRPASVNLDAVMSLVVTRSQSSGEPSLRCAPLDRPQGGPQVFPPKPPNPLAHQLAEEGRSYVGGKTMLSHLTRFGFTPTASRSTCASLRSPKAAVPPLQICRHHMDLRATFGAPPDVARKASKRNGPAARAIPTTSHRCSQWDAVGAALILGPIGRLRRPVPVNVTIARSGRGQAGPASPRPRADPPPLSLPRDVLLPLRDWTLLLGSAFVSAYG